MAKLRVVRDDDEEEPHDIAELLRHVADCLDGSGMRVTRIEIDVPGKSHDPHRAERIKELLTRCDQVRVTSNYAGRVCQVTMDWPTP